MHQDVKDVVGTILRILGGGEIAPDEAESLTFEADDGELQTALARAHMSLLEFAHDRTLRDGDRDRDRAMRRTLEQRLKDIIAAHDSAR